LSTRGDDTQYVPVDERVLDGKALGLVAVHAVPAAALGRALLAFLLQVHELLQWQ
jgi:hypothetical protein